MTNSTLEQFIEQNIELIEVPSDHTWGEIYRMFEAYDGDTLPGDFGALMLSLNEDPCKVLGQVPRRFLQFQKQITSYKIPDGITFIGMCAFEDSGLTQLQLPDTIKEIDYLAFAGTKIKQVVLPSSVLILDNGVFHSCSLLEEADISEITRMGENTFTDCKKLKRVVLSPYVTWIHANNFDGCDNLQELIFPGTRDHFSKSIDGNPERIFKVVCSDGIYTWQSY